MATDGEREGSRSKMRAREGDGEGEGSGERGGRGRKRDAGRAAGRKREPGRGREEEGAERKSECLTIPRGGSESGGGVRNRVECRAVSARNSVSQFV